MKLSPSKLKLSKPFALVLVWLPWVFWYLAILAYKNHVRQGKDPSLYDGVCYKMNGYRVKCSLDQWLTWDAHPVVDILGFVGALVAAAISGAIIVTLLWRKNDSPGNHSEVEPHR